MRSKADETLVIVETNFVMLKTKASKKKDQQVNGVDYTVTSKKKKNNCHSFMNIIIFC